MVAADTQARVSGREWTMPEFNLKQPVSARYIKEIIKLDPKHPVFLVRGMMGEKMVIKCEKLYNDRANVVPDPNMVKLNASVMSAIDNSTKPRVMSAAEIDNLANGLESYKARLDDGVVDELIMWMNAPSHTMIKLPYVNRLTNLENAGKTVAKNVAVQDKSGVRAFAEALNNPGGLELVGQIIAADLFSGNRDRFWPELSGTGGCLWPLEYNDKSETDRLKVIVNPGNLFAGAGKDGALTVKGLDSWDPGSPYSDMTYETDLAQWKGHWLDPINTGELDKFTGFIVDDINLILGVRRRSKFKRLFGARTKRLEVGAEARVKSGVRTGADKIKAKLAGKDADRLAPGTSQRATTLGWI